MTKDERKALMPGDRLIRTSTKDLYTIDEINLEGIIIRKASGRYRRETVHPDKIESDFTLAPDEEE